MANNLNITASESTTNLAFPVKKNRNRHGRPACDFTLLAELIHQLERKRFSGALSLGFCSGCLIHVHKHALEDHKPLGASAGRGDQT